MSYGKVLTVALLGGIMLVGCKKDPEKTEPLKNPDGTPKTGALQSAESLEKGGMKPVPTTQADGMMNSGKNMADHAMDKMGMGTTMPSK